MEQKQDQYLAARDVMETKVIYIDGLETAKDAAELMRTEKVNALIINKRNHKDAYGIVVVNDFINGVIIKDLKSEEVNVYEIMSKPVISIPADLNIRYVPRLMKKAGIRIAPVEENGKFIGMISLSDMILDSRLF